MRPWAGILLALGLVAPLSAAEVAPLRVGMETRQPPWSFNPGIDYTEEDFRKTPNTSAEQLKAWWAWTWMW